MIFLKGRRCAYSTAVRKLQKRDVMGLSLQNTLPPYHRFICIIIKIAHACMRRVTLKEKQNMVVVPLLSFPLRLKVTFGHKSTSTNTFAVLQNFIRMMNVVSPYRIYR